MKVHIYRSKQTKQKKDDSGRFVFFFIGYFSTQSFRFSLFMDVVEWMTFFYVSLFSSCELPFVYFNSNRQENWLKLKLCLDIKNRLIFNSQFVFSIIDNHDQRLILIDWFCYHLYWVFSIVNKSSNDNIIINQTPKNIAKQKLRNGIQYISGIIINYWWILFMKLFFIIFPFSNSIESKNVAEF